MVSITRTFSTHHGLGDNVIHDINSDTKGNIWITTNHGISTYRNGNMSIWDRAPDKLYNGILVDENEIYFVGVNSILKYDGNEVKEISQSLSDSDQITYTCIHKDGNDNIWIGTQSNLLVKYSKDVFQRFDISKKAHIIHDIKEYNGQLLLATEDGVYQVVDNEIKEYALQDRIVRSILKANDESLWLGTFGHGVYRKDKGEPWINFNESNGLSSNDVLSICQDIEDNIWIGTFGSEVIKFDGFKFVNYKKSHGLGSDIVLSIEADEGENIWFGTIDNGVAICTEDSFLNYNTNNSSLSDDRIWSIEKDHNGNMWLGTSKGVEKFNGRVFSKPVLSSSIFESSIYSILEDSEKKYMVWRKEWPSKTDKEEWIKNIYEG